MLRKRKPYLQSIRHNQKQQQNGSACPFCAFNEVGSIIETTETMIVIKNHIPFNVFDGSIVDKHYMVIPKKHRTKLLDFTDAERSEYLELVAKYEDTNFNSFTRSTQSKSRSQPHYHTHLLQTSQLFVRALLYLEKPYTLWYLKYKSK